MDLTV